MRRGIFYWEVRSWLVLLGFWVRVVCFLGVFDLDCLSGVNCLIP